MGEYWCWGWKKHLFLKVISTLQDHGVLVFNGLGENYANALQTLRYFAQKWENIFVCFWTWSKCSVSAQRKEAPSCLQGALSVEMEDGSQRFDLKNKNKEKVKTQPLQVHHWSRHPCLLTALPTLPQQGGWDPRFISSIKTIELISQVEIVTDAFDRVDKLFHELLRQQFGSRLDLSVGEAAEQRSCLGESGHEDTCACLQEDWQVRRDHVFS